MHKSIDMPRGFCINTAKKCSIHSHNEALDALYIEHTASNAGMEQLQTLVPQTNMASMLKEPQERMPQALIEGRKKPKIPWPA